MADTFTHGAGTGWSAKLLGSCFYFATGEDPFDPNWLLTAVLGATLLDIVTDLPVWRTRHQRFGNGRPWYVSIKYDELLTKELHVLEEEGSRVLAWYHIAHSYWAAIITTIVVFALFGPYLASAWAVGYFPHIALDDGTHDKFFPFLPLSLRLFRTNINWWEWKWRIVAFGRRVTIAWDPHIYCISVPTALVGIYHLFQLHGLAP